MIVKPVEGRLVRDPVTMRAVPAAGITVADGDLYWHRAEMEGDVTLEPDPTPATASAAATPVATTTTEAAAAPVADEESH